MSDDRIFALVAMLSILLWIGGGQIADPKMRRLARRGAYVVLGVGLGLAVARAVVWLMAG
jgi:hypothetical protein